MFRGTFTALVTPFRNGDFDEAAFCRLIDFQIENGVTGIVPVGTTGESPTLDHEEHRRVIEVAVKQAAARCLVIAGTGSNATSEAVSLTREAQRAGADGALLVSPYYNKPTQEGLYQHYRKIAEATDLPLVLYSIPGRCGVEIGIETVRRLVETCANIVAIKEAGGSVDRVSQLRNVVPENFSILSGDDPLTLAFMAVGAQGVVSVASNIIPAEVGHLVDAAESGKLDTAKKLHRRYYPLFKDLFLETNPIPIKTALAWAGRIALEFRLPLCEMSESNAARLRATMEKLDLLQREGRHALAQ
jgi:4-hydroxy-tetrahydrodipicolinate synthase